MMGCAASQLANARSTPFTSLLWVRVRYGYCGRTRLSAEFQRTLQQRGSCQQCSMEAMLDMRPFSMPCWAWQSAQSGESKSIRGCLAY